MLFATIVCYVSFILLGEITSSGLRSIFGGIVNSGFNICGFIYILIYKYTDSWRAVFITSTIVTFITGIIFALYSKESPKYYIIKKDFDRFIRSIRHIAHRNKRHEVFNNFYLEEQENIKENFHSIINKADELSSDRSEKEKKNHINNNNNVVNATNDNLLTDKVIKADKIEDISNKTEGKNEKEEKDIMSPISVQVKVLEVKEEEWDKKSQNVYTALKKKKYSPLDLVRYKSQRMKFLILCALWFFISSNFYGITINLKNLKGDIYVLGIIMYAVDTVAYTCGGLISNYLGRRLTILISLCIASVSFGLNAFIPFPEAVSVFFSFLSRFAISTVFNLIFTYSLELYPTVIRSYGFGINTLFAKMGNLLTPIIIEYLIDYINLIFMFVNVFNFVIVLFLPETLNQPLPDLIPELCEVDEAEEVVVVERVEKETVTNL